MNTSHYVPTSGTIQSVCAIKTSDNSSYGSCFMYHTNSIMYLITATHLINKTHEGVENTFSIFHEDKWKSLRGTPYFSTNNVDIAIVKTTISTKESTAVPLDSSGSVFGQDVFFMGFPYFGLISYPSLTMNNDHPLPFIKKATLSYANNFTFLLDCHNNPGFSGGPVVFYDKDRNQKVLGIMSGYIPQQNNLQSDINKARLPYYENSGIAVAHDIKYAMELISSIK